MSDDGGDAARLDDELSFRGAADRRRGAARSPNQVSHALGLTSRCGNVWVRGGQAAGPETMWVRAFDGTDWSGWDPFTLVTTV